MLFSQLIRVYHCSNCQHDMSQTIPTSVVPMLMVWWASGVMSFTGFIQEYAWWQAILMALTAPLFVGLLCLLLLHPRTLRNTQPCPHCLHVMTRTQSGLVSGGGPAPAEILSYVITLLVGLWVLISHRV